jgi:hypothetical protein
MQSTPQYIMQYNALQAIPSQVCVSGCVCVCNAMQCNATHTRAHTLTRTLGLYWIVVYCIAVCIVLCTCTIYSNVLYIELWCIVLCSLCVALSCLVLCRIALHCTHTHTPTLTLCIVLYCIVSYCIVVSTRSGSRMCTYPGGHHLILRNSSNRRFRESC